MNNNIKYKEIIMIKDIVYFAKVKSESEAIIPTKREEDGCYDLYAYFQENEIVIPPHQVKLIPTGIASAFSPTYRVGFRERGSNTKSNLEIMAGQIDSGFRGEWFVALQNNNSIPVEITKSVNEVEKTEDYIRVPYSKAMCQFAVEEVPPVTIKETTYDEILKISSQRGLGCLGSSNK